MPQTVEVVSQKELLREVLGKNVLICLLDACRYDSFASTNWIKGNLQKATSAGSTTWEWARNTFTEYYPDVVYVSATPYIAGNVLAEMQKNFIALEHFPAVNDVWDWGYDEDLGCALPETVVAAVISTKRSYPDKTIIAHFMQPHAPYIGTRRLLIEDWESMSGQLSEYEGAKVFPHIETIIEGGFREYLIDAYHDNLKKVLISVQKLSVALNLPTFITADHGEGFGENGIYGHEAGIRTPELIEVPWFSP